MPKRACEEPHERNKWLSACCQDPLMSSLGYGLVYKLSTVSKEAKAIIQAHLCQLHQGELRPWVMEHLLSVNVPGRPAKLVNGNIEFRAKFKHNRSSYNLLQPEEECRIIVSLWQDASLPVEVFFRFDKGPNEHTIEVLCKGFCPKKRMLLPVRFCFPKLDSGEDLARWYVDLVEQIHRDLTIADACGAERSGACGLRVILHCFD